MQFCEEQKVGCIFAHRANQAMRRRIGERLARNAQPTISS
jgi:hypothetical protein